MIIKFLYGGRRGGWGDQRGRRDQDKKRGGALLHHEKPKRGGSNKTRLVPMARTRNSSWELGYGERRCGFNTKHQSTTKGLPM